MKVLCEFEEPIKKNKVKLIMIPLNTIEPSPYQRNISKQLVQKLAISIDKLGFISFPVVVENNGYFYVVDGQHRVEAMKSLVPDNFEIPCILVEGDEYTFSLYYNIEKAPSIRDKSYQAYKLYIDYLDNEPMMEEVELSKLIDVPYYITCGFALEIDNKFSPSLFESILKKVDNYFLNFPLEDASIIRKERANLLVKAYEKVNEKYDEIGVSDYFVKQKIVSTAFSSIYGGRVRIIEDDFDTCFRNLIEKISEVEI